MKIHSHALVPAALGDKTQYISRHANDSTVRFGLVYPGRLSPARLRQAVKELVGRLEILHSSFAAREDRLGWMVNPDWTVDQAFCCRRAENLQQELDNIIPGLAPLALTVFLAWLYRKNISSLKLVALIFVFSLIFSLIL